jgi:hypothetical protein
MMHCRNLHIELTEGGLTGINLRLVFIYSLSRGFLCVSLPFSDFSSVISSGSIIKISTMTLDFDDVFDNQVLV